MRNVLGQIRIPHFVALAGIINAGIIGAMGLARGRRPASAVLKRAWGTRGVTLGALAVGVAVAGEGLLFGEESRGWGVALLAAAALLAALAWSGVREKPLLLPRSPYARGRLADRRLLALRLAGITGALLAWWGAILA